MGCFASKDGVVSFSDGTEKDFHDRYMEDRVLGEGEFGVVKMVHDMRTRNDPTAEPLACKILRKGFTFKDNTIYAPLKPEVLERECRILKELAGKMYNLRLEGLYEGSGIVYLVTEYCAGGEMMEYVTKVYPDGIRTEDASRVAYQLLSAVNHCAKHGVIHRDIKPENTMFTHPVKGSELRLIDYGSGTIDDPTGETAEPTGVEKAPGLLQHTTFAGSAFYISPEMFQRKYTSKTDVWSVGATLYVLVAGYPADELQKAFNILQKSKGRDLRKLPHMPESMPDSYFEMLDDLLTYRHKKRKSAGELLDCEFVQFHREHSGEDGGGEDGEGGLSLADVAAAAAGESGEGSTGRRKGRTQSIVIEGSTRRHAEFLEYGKFERALTTLLATILSPEELMKLLAALESRIIVKEGAVNAGESGNSNGVHTNGSGGSSTLIQDSSHGSEAGGGAVEVMSNERKLQIVKVAELRTVLQELGLTEAVDMMTDLPNSATYPNFAYHTALLQQFAKNQQGVKKAGAGRAAGRAQSTYAQNNGFDLSSHSHEHANSVHGGRVWDSIKGKQRKKASRGNSFGSDVLNSSSHM